MFCSIPSATSAAFQSCFFADGYFACFSVPGLKPGVIQITAFQDYPFFSVFYLYNPFRPQQVPLFNPGLIADGCFPSVLFPGLCSFLTHPELPIFRTYSAVSLLLYPSFFSDSVA
jgi:hypothetical protein